MAIKAKPATNTATAKVTAPAVDEKQKANRNALVVSLVPAGAKVVTKYRESEKAFKSAYFGIVSHLQDVIAKKALSHEEGEQLLKLSWAESYGLDVTELQGKDALKNHGTVYTTMSRIKTLLFPVDDTQAKRLKKAIADGESIQTCLEVARKAGKTIEEARSSSKTPTQKRAAGSAGSEGNATGKKGVIETEEELKTSFAVVISQAKKGGMELDLIEEVFASQLAEWQEKSEGEGEEEETE